MKVARVHSKKAYKSWNGHGRRLDLSGIAGRLNCMGGSWLGTPERLRTRISCIGCGVCFEDHSVFARRGMGNNGDMYIAETSY